jgi:S-DNA-T family DNA segregation ATPase FtsK/SpoIIIE
MTKRTTEHPGKDPFDLIAEMLMELVWQLIRAAGVVMVWALLFPMISVPIGAAVAAWVLVSRVLGVVVAGASVAGIMLWRWKCPEMFQRWITIRARHRFLRWWRYRRRWAKRLQACSLTVTQDDSTIVPRLVTAEIGDAVDRLRVRMLPGQCPDDYASRVDRIAHTFGAQSCRAVVAGPALMEIVLRQQDSLAETIDLPPLDSPRRNRKKAA